METYIRPLSIRDLDQCAAVESAAFPSAEAATREKIEYRLTVCPEICLGLFARAGMAVAPAIQQEGNTQVIADALAGSNEDTLIAHAICTKSTARVVQDEDMSFPPNWKEDPSAKYEVGHRPEGRTIALHSLAVLPSYQKSGFGKALMKSYIDQMRHTGQADRISLLTYDKLVSYYQKLGFAHYGKSQSEYAGIPWHDLAYEFSAPPATSN